MIAAAPCSRSLIQDHDSHKPPFQGALNVSGDVRTVYGDATEACLLKFGNDRFQWIYFYAVVLGYTQLHSKNG